jgi:hypothetical protein
VRGRKWMQLPRMPINNSAEEIGKGVE